MAVPVTVESFEREVLASSQPVLVDFWAPWCGPCTAIARVLDQIAGERNGELKLVKVDIDREHELAGRYGVVSIPTVFLFEEGKPVARSVGAKSKSRLERALGLPPREAEAASRTGEGLLARLGRRASAARRRR